MQRGRRPIKQGEIRLKPGYPNPPTDLDKFAADAYDSLCRDLDSQGMLTTSDAKLIEMFARSYSSLKHCEAAIKEHGAVTVHPETKRLNRNPALGDKATALARCHLILRDLRLSPVTRSNAVGVNDVDSPIANLFKEMGDS
jgi:P27 family predicted phage terminase small subunit